MKKALIIASGMLAFIAAGVLFYVSNINWNDHKDKIAAQISELTGKKVVFEGPLEMSIFPSPYLTASDVKVYNESGAYSDTPLAEIKSLIAKLSLKSFISGDWDVRRMSLVEPEIIFDISDAGTVNWQSKFSMEQEQKIKEIEISLDSVTLEQAKVRLLDAKNGVDATLNNLNAEIIAQSVFGPYRIEGSYVRNNRPEGFAVSFGQFAENFATSVNLVINYPSTQSYIRFDGSVLFKERSLTGNVIFESSKVADFANEMLQATDIGTVYNLPLVISAAISADKSKIDLSNVVVKYGKSSGAGNVLIPLNDNVAAAESENIFRPTVEAAFNMTDFDLQPVVNALGQVVKKYQSQGEKYKPDLGFNLIGDIKSLKSYYNGETLRDLSLSFDWIDNQLTLRELKAGVLADTAFSADGSVTADNAMPAYDFNLSFTTGEFAKLSTWLGYEIKPVTPATYQKAAGTAKIQGNLQNIQVSPYELTLDKTVLNGDAGFILGDQLKSFIIINADTVNFDNYIAKLPANEAGKSFASRLAYRFRQMEALNDKNIRIMLKLNLGIYDNLPFENVDWEFNLADGVMNIDKLQIGSVAGSSISAAGILKGFGSEPEFQNMKYSLIAADISSLLNKFEISAPNLNTKVLKRFSSRGVMSGNTRRAAVKTISKLENINVNYNGIVDYGGELTAINGEVEVRSPDFVKMVNDLNYNYSPKAFSLGLFLLKAKVLGNRDKYEASDVDMNIGSNNFKGSFSYDKTSGRAQVRTTAKINKFEIERFLNEDAGGNNRISFQETNPNSIEFLAKPILGKNRFNYAPFNEFDLSGSFVFDNLSYRDIKAGNTEFKVSMQNGTVSVADLFSRYNGGTVTGNLELVAGAEPTLKGRLQLQSQDILDGTLSGKVYGIRYGKLNSGIDFNTSAVSFDEMLNALSAKINFSIQNPVIKGWNLPKIADDLETRDKAEGLAVWVQNNLHGGETQFASLGGELEINKGQYKFSDTVFEGKDWEVVMANEGSISGWDMKASFEVVWLAMKNMPGFSFTMNGTLDAPVVTADVSKISNMYEERKARIEAARKAEEAERRNKLNAMMAEQQDKAKALKQIIDEQVMPAFSVRNNSEVSETAKQQYAKINARINADVEALEKIFTQAMTPEFDENLIGELKKQNLELAQSISAYVPEIETVYRDDVRNRIIDYHTRFQKVYGQANNANNDYLDRYKRFPQRLVLIDSSLSLNRQPDISKYKNNIDNNLIMLNDMRYDITKSFGVVRDSNDISRMDVYAEELSRKLNEAEKELTQMQDSIVKLFEVSEAIVQAEEAKARQRKHEAEVQRKVEENTGTISVVGTGKVTKVVPSINDVERKEEAVRNDEVKVLDFSNDRPAGVVRQDSAPVSKVREIPSGGLLTKASGEVVSASGKVVKQ